MKRFFTFFLLLITCTVYLSCEKRPKNILAKSEMTNVLYDYHIAQAILGQEGNGKDNEYKNILDAVLSKHNITQAEFDSSIVWYNVHADDLEDIYKELENRFNARAEEIKLTTGENEMATIITENGDTTNLWNGPKTILLRNQDILAIEKFSYKADTSFHHNDRFLLLANMTFLGTQDVYEHHNVTASLSIHDEKGNTFSDVKTLGSNTKIQLDIASAEGHPLKSISGSFYYQNDPGNKSLCVISQIELIRMRQPSVSTTDQDTIKESKHIAKDTLSSTNTIKEKKQNVHLSPEQIRQERMQGKEHMQIRTTPEIKRNTNTQSIRRRRKIQN